MNRIPIVCVFFVFCCFATTNIATSQWNFAELINRISQEKSKVVSYRLALNQIPEDGTLRFARCTWIQEFSNVGDHHVVAVIQRNEKNEPTFWGLWGRSDDICIAGSSDGNGISISVFNPDYDGKVPKHMDWRVIGLGLCGDIGDTFETVAKNIASWDKTTEEGHFFNTKSGLKVEHADARIVAEIADGLRISQFSVGIVPIGDGKGSNFSEWKVEYKKQSGGLILPVSATLQCGKDKARYELVWEIVNEPLKLGIPTAERFQKAIPKSKIRNELKSK